MALRIALAAAFAAALLIAGCDVLLGRAADPAIYRIDRADAVEGAPAAGWLFGTIHALPDRVDWRTDDVERVVAGAGMLVVEIDDLDDDAAMKRIFAELATTPGLPPLDRRIAPEDRPALAELLDRTDMKPGQFTDVETWAAAMLLASQARAAAGLNPENGVDRALIGQFADRPVVGLETIGAQMAIFDTLAPAAQLDLLAEMLDQGATYDGGREIAEAWMKGDARRIAELTAAAMDRAPELRTALLTRRNAEWIERIVPLLEAGRRPLIAVGAGHVGGDDGLIALLEQRGWRVRRIG